jgi:hypothetical protein
MSEPSERIHAALRRFKAAGSVGGQQVNSTEPNKSARGIVVVNEQNLAALVLTSVCPGYPEAPGRELGVSKGR